MTTEQIHLERVQDRPSHPVQRPEPDPLFSIAERLALWAHQFGKPATDAEWWAALADGYIKPSFKRTRRRRRRLA